MENSLKFFTLKSGEIISLSQPKNDQDFADIDRLASQIAYDCGLEVLKIYYEIGHENWIIARNSDQELIGYHLINSMPNGIYFGFQIVVRNDFKGKGLGKLMQNIPDPWMGNSTAEAMEKIFTRDVFYHQKLLYFQGKIQIGKIQPPPVSTDYQISTISSLDYGILAKFFKISLKFIKIYQI